MLRIAIIGRPNVGKSTLFNILTQSRKAVVRNEPGVTRDILIERAELWGKEYELLDTGGITESADRFSSLIREQVISYLRTVDYLILVFDAKAGLCPEDRDILTIAKQAGREFLMVVNKLDRQFEEDSNKAEFYELGEDLVAASFENRRGITDVLEWISSKLTDPETEFDKGCTFAFVGKPNVGKSSLSNALLGEKRMLVSDIAGTTVDAVDAPFTYNNKRYTLVDTAGLRKKARREDGIEILSAFKSQDAIERAQVLFLVVDGTEGPTDQDAKILEQILELHKGVILVANKSDLADRPEYRKWFRERVARIFHFFEDIPIVFTSAVTKQGFEAMMKELERVNECLNIRIGTGELNEFFFEVIRKAPAPVYGTKNVKFYYLTQTHQVPPSFIAFANYPDGVDNAYRRFLSKQIKERWNLDGIPIRIFAMKSRSGTNSKGRD